MFSKGFSGKNEPVPLSEEGRLPFEKGMIHYENGKYSEAVTARTNSIEVQPTYSFGWYYRARAYDAMGKSDLAIRDLEHALTLYPHNPIFRQELKRVRSGKK
jgi:tetratricopeptide (TPR) repeat protein